MSDIDWQSRAETAEKERDELRQTYFLAPSDWADNGAAIGLHVARLESERDTLRADVARLEAAVAEARRLIAQTIPRRPGREMPLYGRSIADRLADESEAFLARPDGMAAARGGDAS